VIGSETDVLFRLIKAAKAVNADIVLRATTENPFVHWEYVNDLIKKHRATGADIIKTRKS
jgi:spore coat polysaccharide biosynthesis protein SpsF (cytidylyltransferase family)